MDKTFKNIKNKTGTILSLSQAASSVEMHAYPTKPKEYFIKGRQPAPDRNSHSWHLR